MLKVKTEAETVERAIGQAIGEQGSKQMALKQRSF
jgi:hypothetical protein